MANTDMSCNLLQFDSRHCWQPEPDLIKDQGNAFQRRAQGQMQQMGIPVPDPEMFPGPVRFGDGQNTPDLMQLPMNMNDLNTNHGMMTVPVNTGGDNIVNAAVVPCNGGYAIPVISYNGGYAIAALTYTGNQGVRAGSNSHENCNYNLAVPSNGSLNSLELPQDLHTPDGSDEDTINDIDQAIRQHRMTKYGMSPASRGTTSTGWPSDSSRQLSAVSSSSDGTNNGARLMNMNQGDGQWRDLTSAMAIAKALGKDQKAEAMPSGGQGFQMFYGGGESQSPDRLFESPESFRGGPGAAWYGQPSVDHQPNQQRSRQNFRASASASQFNGGMPKEKTRKPRANDPMSWDDGVVTVMIRQIPRQYSQLMLLKEVNRHGFEGQYDFFYLPFDLKKGINVGYGFVSFVHPHYALAFREAFEGVHLEMSKQSSGKCKPLHVHPASVQGYDANYKHFMSTKTGQKQDPQFSPLFFPHGKALDEQSAGQLGGGLFAAHKAALVSMADTESHLLQKGELCPQCD
mmetsp:Transcript_56206/g.100147  ORF Transcript_56206/g.100147 Transcript_56206/m.100147 type:complete len:515 (-) Transcript_56206:159-1703(-)|eukprot:CAMPEP_0197622548 /NCGR_PEP_ID=MMETSP1338-20131121/2809_1 /TAXON_ID=43686 ORGANISM="Pelagodinium beii, Strain RCC1491" /NCGR_SAMPLE_ID=MMETSP1338 /ASSEMBLY_ACC=CAM_ASM_000754 /LENGTH=514 /DNA_ID=CAMNT_0043192289 /DNA_START=81 /DNA_END=1625 /DNA_ORIENTATION=+